MAQQSSPLSPTLLLVSLTQFLVSLMMTRLLVSLTPLTALLRHCLLSSLTAPSARARPCSSLAAAPAHLPTFSFFLKYAGELRIIILIVEKGVIHRPKHTHTHTHLLTEMKDLTKDLTIIPRCVLG